MANSKVLDGPIPGESLTRPVGGAAYERPTQFSDMHEALEFMFDRLSNPKMVARMITIMKAGAPAESVARTILMTGFMQGKWTVDMALLLGPTLVRMVVAVAIRAGMPKNQIKVKNPDKDFEKFVKDFKDYMPGAEMTTEPTNPTQDVMRGL